MVESDGKSGKKQRVFDISKYRRRHIALRVQGKLESFDSLGVLRRFANVRLCPTRQCPANRRRGRRQLGGVGDLLRPETRPFNRRHFQMPLPALWPHGRRRERVQPGHFPVSPLQSPQRRGIRRRIRSFDPLQRSKPVQSTPIHPFFESSRRIRLCFCRNRGFFREIGAKQGSSADDSNHRLVSRRSHVQRALLVLWLK